ncbi:hypothetical protein I79_020766 [Cricetulus griseus]|uniref:Uncharacterized protein n=1 Tax=Cricetulus griseus TaxID=10029 RepID=G3IAY1_CRIGR|nr:hypothetical protein I79_020766 [Cricetulus griseus]
MSTQWMVLVVALHLYTSLEITIPFTCVVRFPHGSPLWKRTHEGNPPDSAIST